jgi:hypothetical protein
MYLYFKCLGGYEVKYNWYQPNSLKKRLSNSNSYLNSYIYSKDKYTAQVNFRTIDWFSRDHRIHPDYTNFVLVMEYYFSRSASVSPIRQYTGGVKGSVVGETSGRKKLSSYFKFHLGGGGGGSPPEPPPRHNRTASPLLLRRLTPEPVASARRNYPESSPTLSRRFVFYSYSARNYSKV